MFRPYEAVMRQLSIGANNHTAGFPALKCSYACLRIREMYARTTLTLKLVLKKIILYIPVQ
jgi:hypothetical protein